MSDPQPLVPNPDLDSLVRRVDEDRWLASRFAPKDVRARLIALYALNYEIARISETVTQSAIGDIRLAWWREALAEIATGKPPRAHPALTAFAEAQRAVPTSLAPWEAMIEARGVDLEPVPFARWGDLDAYVDGTSGGLMRLALEVCGAGDASSDLVRSAARAWGYIGLLRAEPVWRMRGRSVLPREGGSTEKMLERAAAAYAEGRSLLAALPSAAFPAFGYIALGPGYLRTLRRGRTDRPLLARQLRLIAAAAIGRI